MRYASDERGMSIIDILIVVSIMGVLAIGASGIIGKAMRKVRLQQAVLQIQDVRKNIQGLYAPSEGYTGIGAVYLLNSGAIPTSMIAPNQSIVNSFGGRVSFAVGDSEGEGMSFKVTFSDIPAEGCVDMSMINWDVEGVGTKLSTLDINNIKFTWEKGLPLHTPDVIDACSRDKNIITWEFY